MKTNFFSLFFIFCYLQINAQFFNAIGITAGATYANQYWNDDIKKSTESKNFVLGYNGSVMAEFFSGDWVRWVSEIQFNQKGSIDRDSIDYTTKLNYLSFNNFLKIRYEMVSVIPYVLIGPRIEYLLSGSSESKRVTGTFNPLHVNLAGGLGLELVSYGPFKFFTEAFYTLDLTKAYDNGGLNMYNQSIELRVGVKYVFKKKSDVMDCNSPTYVPM